MQKWPKCWYCICKCVYWNELEQISLGTSTVLLQCKESFSGPNIIPTLAHYLLAAVPELGRTCFYPLCLHVYVGEEEEAERWHLHAGGWWGDKPLCCNRLCHWAHSESTWGQGVLDHLGQCGYLVYYLCYVRTCLYTWMHTHNTHIYAYTHLHTFSWSCQCNKPHHLFDWSPVNVWLCQRREETPEHHSWQCRCRDLYHSSGYWHGTFEWGAVCEGCFVLLCVTVALSNETELSLYVVTLWTELSLCVVTL